MTESTLNEANHAQENAPDVTINDVLLAADADFARCAIDYISGHTTKQAALFRDQDSPLEPFTLPNVNRDTYEALLLKTAEQEIAKNPGHLNQETAGLIFSVIASLHAHEAFAASDVIHGIKRSKNTIEITEELKNLLKASGTEDVQNQALGEATAGGGYSYFMTYLENFKGGPQLRAYMQRVLTERSNDQKLLTSKLQAYWNIFTMLKHLGVSFDQIAEAFEIPSSDTADTKLKEYLAAMTLPNQEDIFTFLTNRADRLGLPDKMRPSEEITADVTEVRNLFPALKNANEMVTISTHTGLGTEPRGVSVDYTYKDRKKIIWQNINPLLDRNLFRQTVGHELTHAAQSRIKEIARINGYYGSNDEPSINVAIDEVLSQMVEEQIKAHDANKIQYESYQTEQTDTDLSVLEKRKQILQALTNRAFQQEMEKIWTKKETGEIRDEDILQLLHEADKSIQQQLVTLKQSGIKMEDPTLSIVNLYNPLFFFDGRNYLLEILSSTPNTEDTQATEGETSGLNTQDGEGGENNDQPEQSTLSENFKQRFGEVWIDNSDAQIVLNNLLLQTGQKDFTLEKLIAFATVPIEQAKQELAKAKIPGFSQEEEEVNDSLAAD